MLDYQPDYRALYNPNFLRQADKYNAQRQREGAGERRAKVARLSLAYLAEQERRNRAAEARAREVEQEHDQIEEVPSFRETYSRIERRISRATRTPIALIRGERRSRELVMIRQAVAYWAARRTALSYPKIGGFLGGRDHTTIMHAVKAFPAKRAKQGKHRRAAR